jgi:MFS family permease
MKVKLLLITIPVLLTTTPSSALLVAPALHASSIVYPKSATTPLAKTTTRLAAASSKAGIVANDGGNKSTRTEPKQPLLPRELMPITMAVFAQMLGEGIALSSLPLYLTRLGAKPFTVGLAISCFSVMQMTFAPILVGLSSRIGRSIVLQICLAGAAASSLLIAFSGNIMGVIAGRTLAGVFAACVPVAQSGVTDILSRDKMAIGLSRVSAAAQLGVVVGPAVSSIFQETFAAMGLPAVQCLPAVFSMSALFALSVLANMRINDRKKTSSIATKEVSHDQEEKREENDTNAKDQENGVRAAQLMLRTVTIIMGWTAILSNSIYGLFASRFMGFQQPQLSATYSFAAIVMVASQMGFPWLVAQLGAHNACMLGILAAGTGIGGLSLIRIQPYHTALYMVNRAGAAIADTSTVTLVSASSSTKEDRSRNLAYLTSTRAAARIVSPLLSSKLFEMSSKGTRFPGSLPFVTATCFALAVAPFPMLLRKAGKKNESPGKKNESPGKVSQE